MEIFVKYIGYYDTKPNRRSMSVAATNKMDYIARALNDIGESVEIIACGTTANENIPKCCEKLYEKTTIKFFKTHKLSKHKLIRIFQHICRNITLFSYLLKNTKKDEKVMVYHSLGLMRCVYFAKKLKKFNMILEVEEIYNDVAKKSNASVKTERKFIACADSYIFPTGLLNEKLNKSGKPYVLIHGTYQVEKDRKASFNDDKIHVVYAGTFDPHKGGAEATLTAAGTLSLNYTVHICGFGSPKDTEELKAKIDEINKNSKAKVVFEGLLTGENYISFLQKCDIGLSTQNPDAEFNATSFPSKILSYMANGLRVVTVKIPAVFESKIGKNVYYYEEQTPEAVAEAVMNIDLNDGYDGRKRIAELDKEFQEDIKKLLN